MERKYSSFFDLRERKLSSFASRQRYAETIPIISIGAQPHRPVAPGAVARHEYQSKIIRNPFNKRNREVMHDNYGIQLPLIEKQQQHRTVMLFEILSNDYYILYIASIAKCFVRENN